MPFILSKKNNGPPVKSRFLFPSLTWFFPGFFPIEASTLVTKLGFCYMLQSSERKSLHPRQLTAKAPENGCLEEDEVSFWDSAYFQGQAVSFREGSFLSFV